MSTTEQAIWDFLHRHLQSIFTRDVDTYRATTAADLSLYEWFVTPHRQDGLDFHFFMIDHSWAGAGADFRYDLLEPRLQLHGDTAVVSYTFMLTTAGPDGIRHRSHNESRVLINDPAKGWQVVHVHKSPAWQAPAAPPGTHP
ncbi:MAG: nuclear transport factor 2 family protein [Anaerolineales bacterium]|nr:nuclear transport factor 2 family protein [Anaerolineales bacterium]MCA9970049.1 nuclear transport factor 2 family protein [Anaerolineales bacterium]